MTVILSKDKKTLTIKKDTEFNLRGFIDCTMLKDINIKYSEAKQKLIINDNMSSYEIDAFSYSSSYVAEPGILDSIVNSSSRAPYNLYFVTQSNNSALELAETDFAPWYSVDYTFAHGIILNSDNTFSLTEDSDVILEEDKYISNIEIGDTNYLIKSVGLADSNGNAMKTWRGTLAEYNALDTKDDNTLYKITDDTDTGTDILQMIYPVGSVYETSNPTCPLANLFGTWVQEPNIVNDKFVIETYIDGANGYRIWNDGWCEQWGTVTASGGQYAIMNVSLLKTFKDTNYNVSTLVKSTSADTTCTTSISTTSTASILAIRKHWSTTGQLILWKISGYLASDQYTHINVPTYNKFRRIA